MMAAPDLHTNKHRIQKLLIVFMIALGIQFTLHPLAANAETAGEKKSQGADDKIKPATVINGIGYKTNNSPVTDEADNSPTEKEEHGQTPFAYWAPDDSRAFIPSSSAEIPHGIKLVGVIIIKGKKTIAAITVPGFEEPFYVHEKDVIGIPVAKSNKSLKGKMTSKGNMSYIEVDSISQRQIKLFPKTNPRNIQILQ